MKRFVPSLRVSSLLLAIAVVVANAACKDETAPALPPTIGDKIPSGHGAPSTTNSAPAGTPGADKIGSAPDGMPSPHGSHDSPGMGAPAVESKIAALDKSAVVAKVDDATITKGDVDRSVVQAAALARIPPEMLDAQTRAAFEQPAYEKLIERTLLAKEAARRGLVPSDADFAKQREQMLKSLPEGKSLDDVLKAVGADQASFDRDVKVDVTIGNLLKKIEGDVKAPDDAAIKAIYEANKEVFTIPGLTSAAHVLIKVDRAAGKAVLDEAKAKADAIKKEVTGKDAATFAKVAAEKSDDGSGKARGGDIGTFKRGDLFPEFEEVAFKLKEGEIGGPVLTDRGYHVIRGGGVKEGRVMPYAEASKLIAERERVKAFLAAVDALVDDLRAKAKIERVVEPVASPLMEQGAAGGSRVPTWRAGSGNVAPGTANPHGGGGGAMPANH